MGGGNVLPVSNHDSQQKGTNVMIRTSKINQQCIHIFRNATVLSITSLPPSDTHTHTARADEWLLLYGL